MKKINNLELASLIFIQMVTMDLGININIIKNSTGVNGWIVIILSFIIGIIPLSLYMYISNFSTTHPLNEKINILFKKTGKIINFLISIIALVIGIFLLYNSNNFITSQLLYRTSQIMIGIILLTLAIYHNSKGINSITKVSFLLLIINFTLFLLSFFSLSSNINISNLLPVLKENTDNIFLSALKLSSINIFPIIITLSIPKSLVSSENTYNKDIIKTYILAFIVSFLVIFTTYSVLGIELVKIFEYPEYMVLKKVTLWGFLQRIENIVANQWIIGNYIYLTLIIYYLSTNFKSKNNTQKNIFNIIIGILIITITNVIFKNNTIYYNYVQTIFPYITMVLIIFYVIISIKIYIDQKIKH